MRGLALLKRSRPIVLAAIFLVATVLGYAAFQYARKPLAETVSIGLARRDVTAAFHKRRLNFLIVGAQEDEGTTDTLLLAHVDLDRRLATLISIPRDTWVAIPGHGHDKLNSAFGYGGIELTARVVGTLLGTHVDSTFVVDPTGAKQIVDALGGLNVNVEHAMDYDDSHGNLHIHFKAGEQYLSGGQVLEYMRFRHDAESDFGRMRRQQQVLHEIVREIGEPQNWPKIPRLVALARKDVKTPLTDAQLQALVELYRGVPSDNVRTLTLPGYSTFVGDASVVLVSDYWAKALGSLVCAASDPPQDEVLVVNATGLPHEERFVVGALRGGGWNVKTAIDEPAKSTSAVIGSSAAAIRLARDFGFARSPSNATTVELGSSVLPQT